MALSGRIPGSFGGANTSQVRPVITWSATQSISGNYSTVTASLIFENYRTDLWNSYNNYGHSVTLTINGNSSTSSRTFDIRNTSSQTVWTRTVRVNHNSDGRKSFNLSASGSTGVRLGSYNFNGSGTLNTIPRASSITSFGNFSVRSGRTNNFSLGLSRAASGFTHNISLRVAGENVQSWNSQGLPTSLTISESASNRILNLMRNNTSTTAQLRVQTRSGSTNIGSVVTRNATVSVHSSEAPTINSISISEYVSAINRDLGVYVQNKSRLSISVSTAAGYGARDGSTEIKVNGQVFNGKTGTTSALRSSGTNTITVKYTNSRGQSASDSETVTVYAYVAPSPTITSSYRVDETEEADDDGAFAKVEFSTTISSLSGTNTADYKIRYKRSDENYYTEEVVSRTGSYTFPADVDYAYDIQLIATDYFETRTAYDGVLSSFSLINFSADGKGVAFGGAYDSELGGLAQFNQDVHFLGQVHFEVYPTTRLPENVDLNDVMEPGMYYEPVNNRAQQMTNLPVSEAFSLLVERHAGRKQTFTRYHYSDPRTWIRNYYSGQWGTWREIAFV